MMTTNYDNNILTLYETIEFTRKCVFRYFDMMENPGSPYRIDIVNKLFSVFYSLYDDHVELINFKQRLINDYPVRDPS